MSHHNKSGTVLCRYRYDALDRLAGIDNGAQEPVRRFYQKSRLSVEIQGAVRRSVFQFEDQLLAEQRLGDLADHSDLLGTDGQRSVLHVQGSQGAQSTTYNPYGHCPPATTLPGFNGEHRDPVTGHYLLGNGYRAYNPVLMRFNQPDSLSPFGEGGLNAYAYCQGDPVNRRDPSGHVPVISFLGLISEPSGNVVKKIMGYLPGKDLAALTLTSRAMQEHVEGVSIIPWINSSDPMAITNVYKALKGDMPGVVPAMLKNNDGYKKAYQDLELEMTNGFWRQHNENIRAQQIVGWDLNRLGVPHDDGNVRGVYYDPALRAVLEKSAAHLRGLKVADEKMNTAWGEHIDLNRKIRSSLGVARLPSNSNAGKITGRPGE